MTLRYIASRLRKSLDVFSIAPAFSIFSFTAGRVVGVRLDQVRRLIIRIKNSAPLCCRLPDILKCARRRFSLAPERR